MPNGNYNVVAGQRDHVTESVGFVTSLKERGSFTLFRSSEEKLAQLYQGECADPATVSCAMYMYRDKLPVAVRQYHRDSAFEGEVT